KLNWGSAELRRRFATAEDSLLRRWLRPPYGLGRRVGESGRPASPGGGVAGLRRWVCQCSAVRRVPE
ncbi:hypothetical protein ABZ647_14740, partial [Micromonospora aurantiaca]|uniref:hypothetical protein n=1 Tax=Micromonospora aurantiaca (nom. illeg.) TaxID=47850 RepID=UPI00341176C7